MHCRWRKWRFSFNHYSHATTPVFASALPFDLTHPRRRAIAGRLDAAGGGSNGALVGEWAAADVSATGADEGGYPRFTIWEADDAFRHATRAAGGGRVGVCGDRGGTAVCLQRAHAAGGRVAAAGALRGERSLFSARGDRGADVCGCGREGLQRHGAAGDQRVAGSARVSAGERKRGGDGVATWREKGERQSQRVAGGTRE